LTRIYNASYIIGDAPARWRGRGKIIFVFLKKTLDLYWLFAVY